MPSSHLKHKHKPTKMQSASKRHTAHTADTPTTTTNMSLTPTTSTTTMAICTSTTLKTSPKPFAIRVCSAGGSVLPLQEALGNIKTLAAGTINLSPGYESYTRRLLLPLPTEYDTAMHDDLSADEAFELPTPRDAKPSNWRKVRNIVQWTPFIQTYKKHKYPWVQLAGHQGNFRAGHKQGTILKKLCPAEEKALEAIMKDILRPYVPIYSGVIEGADAEKYLQLEDLLSNYSQPCVMDVKMGVRTYLEDELAKAREKPKLRKDMYEKMIQIDPKAPTEAEHRAKAVTKPRYMVWRETISSTATLGFRIEGVRRGDGTSSKDFKTTRTREQVLACFSSFLQGYSHAASRYVQQLKSIKMTLEASSFFKTHELIGSSLLFVHNESSALVRMIDFAKTIPLPREVHITHRSPWSEGTHEDGYLLGLDNLIELFSALEKTPLPPVSLPLTTPNGTVSTNKSPLSSPSSTSSSSTPTSSSTSKFSSSSSSSSFSSTHSSSVSSSPCPPPTPSTSTIPSGPSTPPPQQQLPDTGGGGGGDGSGGESPTGQQQQSPLSVSSTHTTTTSSFSSSHHHPVPTPTPAPTPASST